MKGNVPRDADGRALTRQEQLLLLIEQRTITDDQGNLERYFVPHISAESIYAGQNGREYFDIGYVSGAGDAASLRALERKGLIAKPQGTSIRYGYRITEEGKLKAQTLC
jgi:hypothetical protein